MQESKQETEVLAKYADRGPLAYELRAECANCGDTWGAHNGINCHGGTTFFYPVAKPAQTLGDLLRQALDRGIGKAAPTSAAHVCDVPDGLTLTPADLAMIAKDGPAKPVNLFSVAVGDPIPFVSAKPPIAGLTRVSAQDHRVGGWGFVR